MSDVKAVSKYAYSLVNNIYIHNVKLHKISFRRLGYLDRNERDSCPYPKYLSHIKRMNNCYI